MGEVPSLDGAAAIPARRSRKRRWPLPVGALLIVNAGLIAAFLMSLGRTPEQPAVDDLASPPEQPAVDDPVSPPERPVQAIDSPAPLVPTALGPSEEARKETPTQAEPPPTVTADVSTPPQLPAEAPAAAATVADAAPPPESQQGFTIRKPKVLPPLMSSLPPSVRAGLPELALTVHVFSDEADKSFVFINDRRYQEGETLREGPYLESIEQQGVVLSYRGQQFLLPGRW